MYPGAGDADDMEVLPFQLRLTHQPGQGFQVAPLGDDGDLPFLLTSFLPW